MSNLDTRIRAYIDKVTCLCGEPECECDSRIARGVLDALEALICSRCGCEYVPDRLCQGSNYTLMCRAPEPLPDSKGGDVIELYWHCLDCGVHEAVESTTPDYKLGDWEKCIDCGGRCYVVTLKQGACYEQGRALGLSRDAAWSRAKSALPPQPQPDSKEDA